MSFRCVPDDHAFHEVEADVRGPADRRITAVLGPTNTGKTHFAMDRMLAHGSGMIGFPLRLLPGELTTVPYAPPAAMPWRW